MEWNLRWHALVLAMLVVFGVGQLGCASSETEDPACTDNFDCDSGQQCNPQLGVCEAVRSSNNANPNNTSADVGRQPGPDAGDGTTNPPSCTPTCGADQHCESGQCVPDPFGCTPACGADQHCESGQCVADPTVCTPTCGADQHCESGQCVADPAVCTPACGADQHCESGQCVADPTSGNCTQAGASCDPSTADQGSFWCAAEGDGSTDGHCVAKCTEPGSAEECASGHLCLNIGTQSEPAPACEPSDCQTSSDCAEGTCLQFRSDFGLCIPNGSTGEGQSCDPDSANTCGPELVCNEEPRDSGQGVCRRLCELWSGASGCGIDEMCSPYTPQDGICVTDVESPPVTQPYVSCSTPGNMCTDSVLCLGFVDGSTNCRPYCRPGMGDCPPPPGTATVVCNNYVAPGSHDIGLCWGACFDSLDCAAGDVCVDSICRTTCTAGNELQDCCGGDMPCDWTCENGFCE